MAARLLAVLVALATAAALLAPAPAARAAGKVARVSGSDRIGTAIELSQLAHPDSAPAAVLALAWNFPDALAAAPLAAAVGGPVLLNHSDRLEPDVRTELIRLGVETVYLAGGTSALSADVETAVAELDGVSVERVSGPDRFATAAEIARRAVEIWRTQGHADAGETVLVALGSHAEPDRAWPDALAAGALAGHARWPILLTRQDSVPQATQEALGDLGTSEAVVVGGTAAIPEETAAELGGDGVQKRRIGGTTRHHTSVLLADEAIAQGAAHEFVILATGAAFPDGLAAGPAAYARGGVVLLTSAIELPDAPHVIDWLADRRQEVSALRIAGGSAAISDTVVEQAEALFAPAQIQAIRVADGLVDPVFAAGAPDGRLLVLEQAGRVRAVYPDGGVATFLDIQSRVGDGGERGLLGLALHPSYESNRLLYLHYTDNSGDTQVSEFRASADGATADPGSERGIFHTDQPFSNHNGGMLEFGPDGALYLALGDGGSGGDPQGNGQNPSTPLGAILRMAPDGNPPPGNPFEDGGGHPLVWAYGLRNPWRFSFDRVDERIFIGDVGQSRREEIDVAPVASGGVNYGWNLFEGTACNQNVNSACDDRDGFTFPVLDYSTEEGGNCAVTGGYVYRGRDVPALTGQYFYSDFCAGFVRSFRYHQGEVVDAADWSDDLGGLGTIPSFGVDSDGELLIVSRSLGRVYRIAPES